MSNKDGEVACNEREYSRQPALLPISDDERKELLAHQSADDIRIAEGTKPLDAFRKLALPPLILSAPITYGMPVADNDQEVLKATWDEMVGMPFQDLLALRGALQEIVGRFERTAQVFTDVIERQIRRIVKGDAESDILFEWWRFGLAEIESVEKGPQYVPELWRNLRSEARRTLIGDRIKLAGYEYTESASRFRLTICEHLITRIALFGPASMWKNTPEDERPVFAEPEHSNQPKPYKADMIIEVRRIYLANGKEGIKAACREAVENLGVGKDNTVYQWVLPEYELWGTDRDPHLSR